MQLFVLPFVLPLSLQTLLLVGAEEGALGQEGGEDDAERSTSIEQLVEYQVLGQQSLFKSGVKI